MSDLFASGRTVLRGLRGVLRSRVVLGVAYGVASGLTGLAILLAASPPVSGPLGPASQLILTLLGLNFVLILALVAAVILRLLELMESQSRDAGARLHMRFVRLFALAAVAPAAVVFLFYGVLVSQGVEKWFSDRVRTVVENSATVFRSYVEEQTRYIGDHMGPMATDLNREAVALNANPSRRAGYLEALAAFHGFPSAYLLDSQGKVLAAAETPGAPAFAAPAAAAFRAADSGEIYVPDSAASDVMRALFRLRLRKPVPLRRPPPAERHHGASARCPADRLE